MLTKHVDEILIENLVHHHNLGFDVFLFLDADPRLSAPIPETRAFKQWTLEEFEQQLPGQERVLVAKQNLCMAAGHLLAQEAGYDFFGFIDEDELIALRQPEAFFTELSKVPHALNLRTAEAICTPEGCDQPMFSETKFLHAAPFRRLGPLTHFLFGKGAPTRLYGLQGHSIGKTLYRLPINLPVWNQHAPARAGKRHRPMLISRTAHLAHYDSNNFEKWQQKWQLRLSKASISTKMHRRRQHQFDMLKSSADLREAYETYWCLNKAQISRLRKLGLLLEAPTDQTPNWRVPWGVLK